MDDNRTGAGLRDPALWVGLYRIALGFIWLRMALQKAPWVISPQGQPYGWLHGWLLQEINHPTFAFYTAFLKNLVLPYFQVFGLLTFIMEMAIGVSLVLGFLVPLIGGLGGTLMQINIVLGSYSIPGEWGGTYLLLIGSHIVFMMGRAGRRVGIDSWIARSVPEPAGGESKLRAVLAYVV